MLRAAGPHIAVKSARMKTIFCEVHHVDLNDSKKIGTVLAQGTARILRQSVEPESPSIDAAQVQRLRDLVSRLPAAWAITATRMPGSLSTASHRPHFRERDVRDSGCDVTVPIDHHAGRASLRLIAGSFDEGSTPHDSVAEFYGLGPAVAAVCSNAVGAICRGVVGCAAHHTPCRRTDATRATPESHARRVRRGQRLCKHVPPPVSAGPLASAIWCRLATGHPPGAHSRMGWRPDDAAVDGAAVERGRAEQFADRDRHRQECIAFEVSVLPPAMRSRAPYLRHRFRLSCAPPPHGFLASDKDAFLSLGKDRSRKQVGAPASSCRQGVARLVSDLL